MGLRNALFLLFLLSSVWLGFLLSSVWLGTLLVDLGGYLAEKEIVSACQDTGRFVHKGRTFSCSQPPR